ncbi:doublesex cognate 73A [Oratosquilla oratoria]|uniref:doublesex cognate 73A n=1 Tax=Oratosquilla oratoria TaxID=337810 RepID=UPI003F77238B
MSSRVAYGALFLFLSVMTTMTNEAYSPFPVIEGHFEGKPYRGRDIRVYRKPSTTYSSPSSSHSSFVSQEASDRLDSEDLSSSNETLELPYTGLLDQLGLALQDTLEKKKRLEMDGVGEVVSGRAIGGSSSNKHENKQTDDLYYHFYPHNQHLFNLPECATQQVCNAVYKRLDFVQPLCACPPLSDPCSASFLSNDEHTLELAMGRPQAKAVTLVKTCEPVRSVRLCRSPRDWSILALQNTRTGKAHYLVICKCPDKNARLEGPLNHDQPTYAQVPGIRVYGMMCIRDQYRRSGRTALEDDETPKFPWDKVSETLREERLVKDLLEDHDFNGPTLLN